MPRPKKLSRAEKKAALMERADALIEQMLNWTETTSKPTLTQIEDVALDLRQQFGQALSESAIASQENADPVTLPACPHCGKTMRPKAEKGKTVVARVGELKMDRRHFYCPACKRGLFPPR
jgi:Tfp pilus assembly protein PilE